MMIQDRDLRVGVLRLIERELKFTKIKFSFKGIAFFHNKIGSLSMRSTVLAFIWGWGPGGGALGIRNGVFESM